MSGSREHILVSTRVGKLVSHEFMSSLNTSAKSEKLCMNISDFESL
jgi:hypothetical protein